MPDACGCVNTNVQRYDSHNTLVLCTQRLFRSGNARRVCSSIQFRLEEMVSARTVLAGARRPPGARQTQTCGRLGSSAGAPAMTYAPQHASLPNTRRALQIAQLWVKGKQPWQLQRLQCSAVSHAMSFSLLTFSGASAWAGRAPQAVQVEHVAAGQLLVARGWRHLLAADDAHAVAARQVLRRRVLAGVNPGISAFGSPRTEGQTPPHASGCSTPGPLPFCLGGHATQRLRCFPQEEVVEGTYPGNLKAMYAFLQPAKATPDILSSIHKVSIMM